MSAQAHTDSLDISNTMEPLYNLLELAHQHAESVYETGLLYLSKRQHRYVLQLNETTKTHDEFRKKATNLTTWEKVERAVGTIFLALATVAGIALAATGSILLGACILAACIWKIGSLIVRNLSLAQPILDMVVPKNLDNRSKICRVIEISSKCVDVAADIMLAIGTGYGAAGLAGQAKNVFQLASLGLSGTQASLHATTGIKRAQARSLERGFASKTATSEKLQKEIAAMRERLEQNSNNMKNIASYSSAFLDADKNAKSTIFVEEA